MDIGEYSAVVPEQLQLVFRIAVHNTAMDGCALEIHDLPRLAGYVRTIEANGLSKNLVAFAPAGAKKSIIFFGDMCGEENTSQAASVEFCASAAHKLCAQQTSPPCCARILFDRRPQGLSSLRACFVGCSVL